jgi:hypothetical protein
MSPARQHRDRLAASAATSPATPIAAKREGGQPSSAPAIPEMTPARVHRVAAIVAGAETSPAEMIAAQLGSDPAAAQIQLRLVHDKRTLKDMHSIERKIDAKRLMIVEYRDWCDTIMASTRTAGLAEEVLPTMMVWSIDIADWDRALDLAAYVLEHDVPLPKQYQRTAPALITEEVALAALNMQTARKAFPLEVLERVEELTGDYDMHDQIRAKLMKAIGAELMRGDVKEMAPDAIERSLTYLRRAHSLDSRVGVTTMVRGLEKALKLATESATPPAPPEATEATDTTEITNTDTAGTAG